MYRFDLDLSVSLARAGLNALEQKRGTFIAPLKGGGNLLMAHGCRSGEILADDIELEYADVIACCFPRQVKARNPQIADKIVGDWVGETGLRVIGSHGQVCAYVRDIHADDT